MSITKRFDNLLLIIFLVSMFISLSFFLGEGNRNLLLITEMGISILFFVRYLYILPITDFIFVSLILLCILPQLLFHPETLRWSTVLYSCMFFLFFMLYRRVVFASDLKIEVYLKLLKYIIYAYAIVLLLQQICVLLGLPIFNISNYDISEPWKLNSLSSEPSHTARFMALAMFSYLKIKDVEKGETISFVDSFKSNVWVWISFFWVMMTSISGTCILLLFIIFIKYINLRTILFIGLLSILLVYLGNKYEYRPIQRVYRIAIATLTLNKTTIIITDHSASLRIVPAMVCGEEIVKAGSKSLFGQGVDYTASIMYQKVPGVHKGYRSGGLLSFALDYGLIPFFVLLFFTLYICLEKGNLMQTTALWFLCVFLSSINSQILWAYIMIFYLNKHFKNNCYESIDSRAI